MHSNGAEHPLDESTTIIGLFDKCVRNQPEAVSLIHGHTRWTYRQLDQLANALAWKLALCGRALASPTPLVVGEGIELPLSVLALIKLGVPWVLIDAEWPPALIARCLSEVEPTVTVCTTATVGSVTGHKLVVDRETLQPRAEAPEPGRTSEFNDVLYGFYTSGSSGTPKCALNLHGGVLNRLLAMTRTFVDEGAVVLQNSRSAFDSSIWQLLWPLTRGGTVVVPARDGILDLQATIDEIARHAVTMTDFVPSVLNVLIRLVVARPELRTQLKSLRRVLVGGEALSAHTVAAAQAIIPHARLTNTYGATECSIGSIWHHIETETPESGPIPIGRAIDNTAAIILNDSMVPVAPGELGEIYLGGLCVGAGYFRNESRSRDAFVSNPFPGIPGTRLYRTGDLGYMRAPGGDIYYAGRIDDEVKLNGARANLGDIEMVLQRCPLVDDASVVVGDDHVRSRLTAYVVARQGQGVTGIRQFVSRVVPRELVPSRIILVDRIPLSSNGKVDRRALREMASVVSEVPTAQSPSAAEEQIVEIWTRILRPDHRIGPQDNFFDLGGDSLDLQRLVAEVEALFGRPVSIREVARVPTVRGLASLSRRPADCAGAPGVVNADTVGADLALPADVVAPAGARPSLQHVLLTGATGFVGTHLLGALLTDTTARVACLIRAGHRREAEMRLRRSLRRQQVNLDRFWNRIDIVVGDLTLQRLGLRDARYEQLALNVDTVVHCAAVINLLLDYSWHRPTNVFGTQEIIRLAATGSPKHLHYISSLAVLQIKTCAGVDDEAPVTGYTTSKWVAEKLLESADDRGIASSAYRLGEVLPNSTTGACSDGGMFNSVIRAFVELGVFVPTDVTLNYVPVDVAASIVAAGVHRGIQRERFNVIGHPPLELGRLFSSIATACSLRQVSYQEFWSRLRDCGVGGRRSAQRLLSVLPDPTDVRSQDPLRVLFRDPTPDGVRDQTELIDVPWPPASRLAASYAAAWRDYQTHATYVST